MNHMKTRPLRYVSFLCVSIIACRPYETSFKRWKGKKIVNRHSPSVARMRDGAVYAAVNGPRRFR